MLNQRRWWVAAIAVIAFGIGSILPMAGQSPAVVLRFGTIVTGFSPPLRNGFIVVEGDRIKAVGGGDLLPAGVQVVDLRQYTAIPGLIDAHTHMTYYWDPKSGTLPLRQPRREPAVTAELAMANALATIRTGVTTVRDLGASGGTDYLMRDQIAAGFAFNPAAPGTMRAVTGPRMFVAGQGISAGRGGPNPDGMKAMVEARVKAGSDWIKVYASRGSFQSVDTTQTMTYEEMRAIVDAAHAIGKPVAIHSYGASGVKDAVRAGADSIEHGIELDDETLTMMKKQGTVWVPTVDHNRYYVDARDEYGFAPETIPPLNDYIAKNLESVRRAHAAGVTIAMGSDAVYSGFGQNTRELLWFVKAGMSPAQALATATTIPAKMLGRQKDLGVIAPGYLADIVAVEGEPLRDINVVVNNVRLVMKAGVIVQPLIKTETKKAPRK